MYALVEDMEGSKVVVNLNQITSMKDSNICYTVTLSCGNVIIITHDTYKALFSLVLDKGAS